MKSKEIQEKSQEFIASEYRVLYQGNSVKTGFIGQETTIPQIVLVGEGSASETAGVEVVVFKRGKERSRYLYTTVVTDLVTAYRMLVLVEQGWNDFSEDEWQLRSINHAQFDRSMPDKDGYRYRSAREFEEERFNFVLEAKIPDEIVNVALQLNNEGVGVQSWPFEQAIALGQLEWSEKLAMFGVTDPKKYEEYEKYLKLYARHEGFSRYCLGMFQVEDRLDEVLEFVSDVEDYSRAHVLAYALAIGGISSKLLAQDILRGMVQPTSFDLEEDIKDALLKAIDWVNTYTDFDKITLESFKELNPGI